MSNNKREAAMAFLKEGKRLIEGKGTGALDKSSQNQSSQGSGNIREVLESEMSNEYWKPIADKAGVEPDEVRRLSIDFGEDIVKALTPEQVKDAVIRYVRD